MENFPENSFGLRLRELRRAAGLTQAALARAAGMPDNYVSRWELGHGGLNAAWVPALAAALGVGVADLFARPKPGPAAPVRRGRPRKEQPT